MRVGLDRRADHGLDGFDGLTWLFVVEELRGHRLYLRNASGGPHPDHIEHLSCRFHRGHGA